MSSTIEDKCIAKGVKLTEQRKIIAKVISDSKETYGSKDHPDVDELHKRATSIDKKIREELGISDTLIRLSVGIEDVNDLKKSLDKALNLI